MNRGCWHRICGPGGNIGVAEKVLALGSGLRRSALENRRFLRRVVRFLAAEAGVSQFHDTLRGAAHARCRARGRAWATGCPLIFGPNGHTESP